MVLYDVTLQSGRQVPAFQGNLLFQHLDQRTKMEATCSSEALALLLNCTMTLYPRLSQSVLSSLWELQISGKGMLLLWALTFSVTNSKNIFGIKVKIQLSLCLTERHILNPYGGVQAWFHIFLTSTIECGWVKTPVSPHKCMSVVLQNKLLPVHPYPCIEV
jgi:hypothetical protein